MLYSRSISLTVFSPVPCRMAAMSVLIWTVDHCQPSPLLWADAWLLLLVYYLVGALVKEDGEALAAVLRQCRDVAWAVMGLSGRPPPLPW